MTEMIGSLLGVLLLLLSASVRAEVPDRRFDPVHQTCRIFQFEQMREGARFFKGVCQRCHNAAFDNGIRPMLVLIPRSFSPERWTRIFTEKYSLCAQNGSWKELSADDLLKLNDYLYRGGYGTWEDYTPLEC